MTPSEFKAWFDGFTEAVDEAPSRKQWARIKERVAEIDGKPVTERVYVDRYLPSYPYHYPNWRYPTYVGASLVQPGNVWCNANAAGAATVDLSNIQSGTAGCGFDSHAAMNALGRADATTLLS